MSSSKQIGIKYVQNGQHYKRRLTANGTINTQKLRRFSQPINKNKQQDRGFMLELLSKRQSRQYDALSLLTEVLMQHQSETHHNGRGRGRHNNTQKPRLVQ